MDVALIPQTLLFSIGIFSVAFWPEIPPVNYLLIFGVILAVLVFVPRFGGVTSLLAGVLFAAWYGQNLANGQLPTEFDRQDVVVTGRVVGLPDIQNKRIRFQFITGQYRETTLSNASADQPLPDFHNEDYFKNPQRILLSWYFPQAEPFRQLKPGQRLTLKVRLRRPRGTVNPGGFDYQLWLLRQGITATGYVRSFITFSPEADTTHIDAIRNTPDLFRYRVQQQIADLNLHPPYRALLSALTVGSKSQIAPDDWQAYARAGVIHLMVISGLHVGFAALFGSLLGAGIAKLINLSGDRVNAFRWGCIAAVLMAGLYAMLAGWSIPTQRAFVMVAVFALGKFFARHFSSGYGFVLAIVFVGLLDPLAVMDRGFWLSFCAVAVLLWFLRKYDRNRDDLPATDITLAERLAVLPMTLWTMFKVQLVICLVMAVLLQLFNLPSSWVAPVVNMLAIPWISLIVVPVSLAGVLILPVCPELASYLLLVAGLFLGWFHEVVLTVSQLPLPDSRSLFPSGLLVNVGLVVAGILMVLPLGILTRIPGVLLLIAVICARPEKAELRVSVLDVGQGLAVVVETPQKTLVYDTGPVFSDKLDAGGAIVAPYLTSRGIHQIEKLIISHDDSDHAGGVSGLLNTIAVKEIIADKAPPDAITPVHNCQHNRQWRWQAVNFTLINPADLAPNARSNDNNQSCILLLEYASRRILLPGDIEGQVEMPLLGYLDGLNGKLPVEVLIAPHHGSKTSSTARFVTALSPLHVVFSAGFNHHFGHPHTRVVTRYREQFAQLHNTAENGAIQFEWRGDRLRVTGYREEARRYWH